MPTEPAIPCPLCGETVHPCSCAPTPVEMAAARFARGMYAKRRVWLPLVEYANVFNELSRVQITGDLATCTLTFTLGHLSVEHVVRRVVFDAALTPEIWQAPIRIAIMHLRSEREGSCVPITCGPLDG